MAMNELKETLRHTRCSQATLASKKFTSVLNLLFAFVSDVPFETKYYPIIEYPRARHATRAPMSSLLLLVRYLSEHAANLLHRFVLGFGHLLVNEETEESL